MSAQAEQREKRARIKAFLESRGLEAVVLRKGANIAWMIGGRAHIPTTVELACMDLIVYRDRIVVVTNRIEAPRLQAEELTGEEELIVINWFEVRDAQLPKGPTIGVDGPDTERTNVAGEIEALRRNLNHFEINRLRAIGHDASSALSSALSLVKPSDTEVDVAGVIANEMWQRNLEPVVLLVAGDARIEKFRHPLPTMSKIGTSAMGVICARRKGLIASVTRIVHFGPISQQMRDDYQSLLNVEAAFLDGTKPGVTFAEAFKKGEIAYALHGFDKDEWTKHHQGGPTGYLPRDFPAHEKTTQLITAGNAIAWNPSGKGLKVEDTVITNEIGCDLITMDQAWPTVEIEGRVRPDLLSR
mgnify:FL=1